MRWLIDVPLWWVWVWHSCGVTANNVEVCSSSHPALGVPLDLGGASVEHGRGENGQDSGLGVEDALLQDGLMLLHANAKRNVVVLGPTTQRMQKEDRVLVAAFNQLTTAVLKDRKTLIDLAEKRKVGICYLHKKSVTIVDWIPELESKYGICPKFLEPLPELLWRQPPLVKSVIPLDPIQTFKLATHKPVARVHDLL